MNLLTLLPPFHFLVDLSRLAFVFHASLSPSYRPPARPIVIGSEPSAGIWALVSEGSSQTQMPSTEFKQNFRMRLTAHVKETYYSVILWTMSFEENFYDSTIFIIASLFSPLKVIFELLIKAQGLN